MTNDSISLLDKHLRANTRYPKRRLSCLGTKINWLRCTLVHTGIPREPQPDVSWRLPRLAVSAGRASLRIALLAPAPPRGYKYPVTFEVDLEAPPCVR